MSAIQEARDALYAALSTVEGLRVAWSVGEALDPPAAVVPIPTVTWQVMGPDPTEAVFQVPVVVDYERHDTELMTWLPLVSAAIENAGAGVVRTATPDVFADLPCYRFEIEVPL